MHSGLEVKGLKREVIFCEFHSLEIVSRYRDPQLQVSENDSELFNLRQNILQTLLFEHVFR